MKFNAPGMGSFFKCSWRRGFSGDFGKDGVRTEDFDRVGRFQLAVVGVADVEAVGQRVNRERLNGLEAMGDRFFGFFDFSAARGWGLAAEHADECSGRIELEHNRARSAPIHVNCFVQILTVAVMAGLPSLLPSTAPMNNSACRPGSFSSSETGVSGARRRHLVEANQFEHVDHRAGFAVLGDQDVAVKPETVTL